MTKKAEGNTNKLSRQSAHAELAKLAGKAVSKMTKAEQESLLVALCQITGILDDTGKVKTI